MRSILDKFFELSKFKKVLILAIVVAIIGFSAKQIIANVRKSEVTYQTSVVEKGTLTVSVTATGTVASANSASITTEASGVVSKVYVENGQKVQSGDKIAEIDLDLTGQQRLAQAWASYQSAQNSLTSAKNDYYTLQSSLLTYWKTYMDTAQSGTYQNSDGTANTSTRTLPQYVSTYDQWLAAEAKYKLQESVVNVAQTNLQSAWLSYQQTSSTVYAPITGTVDGLSLQVGSVLTSQSNSSGTAASQNIANIATGAPPIIKVSLTQIDTPKVKVGNKATLTFDAFPDKTYTGKVISIDTVGTVSSGVTTYTAAIKLDDEVSEIYSNMSASATIITSITNDVLLIPSGAVQAQGDQSTVSVLKNGKPTTVQVTTGNSNDTQIVVDTGLSEGDEVVTNIITADDTTTSSTTSIFGGTSRTGSSSRTSGAVMSGPPGM